MPNALKIKIGKLLTSMANKLDIIEIIYFGYASVKDSNKRFACKPMFVEMTKKYRHSFCFYCYLFYKHLQ